MRCPEIRCLPNNPNMDGQVKLVRDVIYSTAAGEKLPLSLLIPWNVDDETAKKEKKPLIVFVQGSAWTTPDRDFELPQLSAFARKGYVVATVVHRDRRKGCPFPAFLQDVKCAIRYLRKNADLYGIDPEKVAVWGTSSGGNAALLVGLTGDDPKYKTEEYQEYSDCVNAVAECFGPTDLFAMAGSVDVGQLKAEAAKAEEPSEVLALMMQLSGGDISRFEQVARDMSPIYQVEKGKKVPPFLLIHGDADPVVPFEQMTSLYYKMLEYGYSAEAWQIEGAVHEGNFWSDAVYRVVEEFLQKNL